MLRYELHPVPMMWRPFVRAIWTLDSGPGTWTECVPASLHSDLVLGETPYLRVVGSETARIAAPALHGLQPVAQRYTHFGGDRLTGAQFHPGGLGAFFADVQVLRDGASPVRPSGVWSDADPATRVGALIARLGAPEGNEDAICVLSALSRHPRVSHAARDLGTTERTLRRATRRRFGMSPKELQRLMRFRRAQALLHGDGERPMADIAYRCGYADQAHFSREWSVLAGAPPSRFRP